MKKKLLAIGIVLFFGALNIFAQKGKAPVEFIIETEFGNIEGVLYDDTPLHRDNFVKLVKEGWYEDSEFHRVIQGFMIQGGHNKEGNVDPGYIIPAEILPNHFHKRGALAAARLGDHVNPAKESSGCQFYIVQGSLVDEAFLEKITQQRVQSPVNIEALAMQLLQKPENKELQKKFQEKINAKDKKGAHELLEPLREEAKTFAENREPFVFTQEQIDVYLKEGGSPHLDGEYTVFGEITKGMEVVDRIASVNTVSPDKPIKKIAMKIKIKQ